MRLNGLGVSPGIGIGRALVVTRGTKNLQFRVPEHRIDSEIARLDAARAQSREQLQHLKERIAAAAGAEHAYLFDAQLLMLDDPMLVDRAAIQGGSGGSRRTYRSFWAGQAGSRRRCAAAVGRHLRVSDAGHAAA